MLRDLLIGVACLSALLVAASVAPAESSAVSAALHERIGVQSARAPRVGLPALTVEGNRIVRRGARYRFFGVNRNSLEWGRDNWGGCGGDGHFRAADFDAIKAWRATAIRFPLSQSGWLGRSCGRAAYIRAVDRVVAQTNARGMYAILDLHWTDAQGTMQCTRICLSSQQPMPDADSVVFWAQVAKRYARNPGVIFNLFNEPHEIDWACWRDGGCTVPGMMLRAAPSARFGIWQTAPTGFQAVGMQQLYDTVRAQGAPNLILVAGNDWASDLSGVTSGYALSGVDIAYDIHVYTQFHYTRQDWDARFGRVAASVPVVSTEFGSADCTADVTSRLLRYFEAPMGNRRARMSWTFWSWNTPGNCNQPSVLLRWDGTPLRAQGRLIHRAMTTAVP